MAQTARPRAPAEPKSPPKVVDLRLWAARLRSWRPSRQRQERTTFSMPAPAPGVLPKSDEATFGMAQDAWEGWAETSAWAQNQIGAIFAEGQAFLGYPILSEMAQRPEYRVISETIASDMTRKWVELKGTGDEAKDDKIDRLIEAVKRFELDQVFYKVAEQDGFFGRGHIYVDLLKPGSEDSGLGGPATDDLDELRTSIGNGRDRVSREKVRRGSIRAFRTVEAIWTYPTNYNSNDPLKADWYRPPTWFVMGKQVDATRLLTFIGREVPDLLKPAYSFGGLSLSQMAKPYVDNWLRTRQSVSDITHSFSVFGLKTNLNALMQAEGEQLYARAETFNALRDNGNLALLDKDTEDFFIATASLASLDKLQAQAQEHMAAVSRIPLVKLLGIQPAGLNASSEGEIRVYYDTIKAMQEHLFRRPLGTCLDLIQLNEFGEVDPRITLEFLNLWELDEAAEAAVQAQKASTHAIYVNDIGAVGPGEVRRAVAADPRSPYSGLEIEREPPPEPPEPEGGEGGGQPPKAPLSNPLTERSEREALSFGHPESGGFRANDDEDAFDGAMDAEWAEHLHPRDAGGKFAKAAEVPGSVHKTLESKGFKLHPESPHAIYTHPGGHQIAFAPPPPSKTQAIGWAHYKDWKQAFGGKGNKGGASSPQVAAYLEKHGIGPTAPAASATTASEATLLKLHGPTYANALEDGGFEKEGPSTEHDTWYKNAAGVHVSLSNKLNYAGNIAWSIWAPGVNPYGTPSAVGEGGGNFQFSLAKVEAEAATTVAASPSAPPKGIEQVLPHKSVTKWLDGKADRYADADHEAAVTETLVIGSEPGAANEGQWQIWRKGEGVVASGHGQESMNSAFEALHPRGPDGKFLEKPEEPAANAEVHGIFLAGLKNKGFESLGTSGVSGAALLHSPEQGISVKVEPYADPAHKVSSTGWVVYGDDGGQLAKGTGLVSLYNAIAKYPAPVAGSSLGAGESAIGAPVALAGLKQVGPSLGTTPGGTYEDAAGDRLYVKQTQSADHTRNEMLAAALFRAAGGDTFTYRRVDGPAGQEWLGSDWREVDKDDASKFTPAERKAVQSDFALHAWLANWDAGGAGPEHPGRNVGIVGGKPVPLDLGGALLYRGAGKPKGAAFGDDATEWDLLRSPAKNPSAAKLFGDMTPEQLKESAARLGNVSAEDIGKLVDQFGPGDAAAKSALTSKLIERKVSVMKQAAAIGKPAPPPPPPEKSPAPSKPIDPAKFAETYDGVVARFSAGEKVPDSEFSSMYHALQAGAPGFTSSQESARSDYKGTGYESMNDSARKGVHSTDKRVKALTDWLDGTSTPVPMILTRRIRGNFAEAFASMVSEGTRYRERGFVSTSLNPRSMKSWGPITMVIDVPAGMKGAPIKNDGESEILFQRDVTHLTCLEVDHDTKTYYMRMDQDAVKPASVEVGEPGEALSKFGSRVRSGSYS